MSKERLKEIKEKYDMWADDFNLDPQDVECLIKQAKLGIVQQEQFHDYQTQNLRLQKRVQELESENNALKTVAMSNKFIGEHYRQQNKRYREALEFYADKENYKPFDGIFLSSYQNKVDEDGGEIARKALGEYK